MALVALVLAPALVMTSGTVSPAEAATVTGSTKSWQASISSFNGNNKCSGSARWVVAEGGMPYVQYNGKCWESWSFGGLGPSDFAEGSFVGLEFSGTALADAGTCGVSGSSPLVGPGGGVAFAGQTTATSVGDCSIKRLCVTVKHVVNNSGDSGGTQCVTFDLGAPPEDEAGFCEAGQLGAMGIKPHEPSTPDIVRFDWSGTFGPGSVAGTWTIYAVVADSGGNPFVPNLGGGEDTRNGVVVSDGTEVNKPVPLGSAPWNAFWRAYGLDWTDNAKVYGMGVFWNPVSAPSGWNSMADGSPGKRAGMHDPATCHWYWGKKVANIPDSDKDEPGLPFVPIEGQEPVEPLPEPPGETSGCDFSVLDPTSYLCGIFGLIKDLIGLFVEAVQWLTSIFGVLGEVLAEIAQLVGKLLDGLWQLLQDLFIPSPESWGWEGFVDQVKERPPTSIAVDVVDAGQAVASGFQSGGSCGVLADFGDGMEIRCGDINNIPGFSALYGVVQAALVGLTAFSIFHILRGVLGGGGD